VRRAAIRHHRDDTSGRIGPPSKKSAIDSEYDPFA